MSCKAIHFSSLFVPHTKIKKMKTESTLMKNKEVTFGGFDKLNLKLFAENLFQIMEKGADSSIGDIGEKGSYTISLNAEFGNGKTTFLKMFEHFVKTEKPAYDVLFINAWESDFYDEPVIAILSEFVNWMEQEHKKTQGPKQINQTGIKQVNQPEQAQHTKKESQGQKTDQAKDQRTYSELIDKTKKIIGKLANHKLTKTAGILGIKTAGILGSQIIQSKTGFNIKELTAPLLKKLTAFFTSKKNVAKKDTQKTDQSTSLGENVFKEFKDRKKAIQKIKKIISEYLSSSPQKETKEKKLLIIVDELDRTRPDYAVHFLEDIKHFFDIQNVVFLVAVNRKQMEATVKCLYGQDLVFDGYYRKFFKHEINLPDPYKEAQRLIDDLLRQKTKVKYNNVDGSTRRSHSYLSCRMFNLTLREVEHFVSTFEMVLGDDEQTAKWCYQDAYSFLICLYMKEKEIFQKILNGQFALDDFIQFINTKELKYKPDRDNNYPVFSNDLLLKTVTYCFVHIKPGSDPKVYYDKIENWFPDFRERTLLDPKEGFEARYGQPAVKICEKINQCKSAFLTSTQHYELKNILRFF